MELLELSVLNEENYARLLIPWSENENFPFSSYTWKRLKLILSDLIKANDWVNEKCNVVLYNSEVISFGGACACVQKSI